MKTIARGIRPRHPVVGARCRSRMNPLAAAVVLPAALLLSGSCRADFALNFAGTTSTSIVHGISSSNGESPFTPVTPNEAGGESAVDPSTGIHYWHYILGDPSSGFAQEVYIQSSVPGTCAENQICTASGGSTASDPSFNLLGSDPTQTGNATGNPSRVIIRQVIGGSWDATTSTWSCDTAFCSEFLKASAGDKPKITQGINEPDFSSTFVIDMSAIAISNNTTDLTLTSKGSPSTGASLTNVQQVIDPATGATISSFDMSKDAQTTFVTGGKYTYVNGGGTLGAEGSYVYVDGGYNPSAVDYTPFLNNSSDANPWSYPASKP